MNYLKNFFKKFVVKNVWRKGDWKMCFLLNIYWINIIGKISIVLKINVFNIIEIGLVLYLFFK